MAATGRNVSLVQKSEFQEIKPGTKLTSGAITGDYEARLEDDKSPGNSDFSGATLQFGMQSAEESTPTVQFAGTGAGGQPGARPHTDSTLSRQSLSSTGSRSSAGGSKVTVEYVAQGFFSRKGGYFEKAVDACKEIMRNDLDGEVKGAWLLSEIDHWDNEKEKLFILTDNSLIITKYDFVSEKLSHHKRILLHIVETATIGDFVYPEKSVMPPRNNGGIRLSWNRGQELSFGQKWNPWCSDIPFLTVTNHPLLYTQKENEVVTYNVDDFCESLIQQIKISQQAKSTGKTLNVVEEPILIESYASLASMIFNQSYLGFSRERGGVSF